MIFMDHFATEKIAFFGHFAPKDILQRSDTLHRHSQMPSTIFFLLLSTAFHPLTMAAPIPTLCVLYCITFWDSMHWRTVLQPLAVGKYGSPDNFQASLVGADLNGIYVTQTPGGMSVLMK